MNTEQPERKPGTVAPTASRPQTPDGYGVPETVEGTLPWTHVHDRITGATNYWVGTTRPDGRGSPAIAVNQFRPVR